MDEGKTGIWHILSNSRSIKDIWLSTNVCGTLRASYFTPKINKNKNDNIQHFTMKQRFCCKVTECTIVTETSMITTIGSRRYVAIVYKG